MHNLILLASMAVSLVSANPETTFVLPGGADMEMVWIEPGTFTMGSLDTKPALFRSEDPQREVTITRGFYLGKFEITQAQWESVMGDRPWQKINVRDNPKHPAVYIPWDHALLFMAGVSGTSVLGFIEKLNAAEGSEMYRLPTEAEWEYACRAGTTTLWSFGDDESELGKYAWYEDNAKDAGEDYPYPHAVGAKLPNPWGLYDMHGNVCEWVQDWWDCWYTRDAQIDPTGPSTGSGRVVRGGGFDDGARSTRPAYRYGVSPGRCSYYIGARLLRQGP